MSCQHLLLPEILATARDTTTGSYAVSFYYCERYDFAVTMLAYAAYADAEILLLPEILLVRERYYFAVSFAVEYI